MIRITSNPLKKKKGKCFVDINILTIVKITCDMVIQHSLNKSLLRGVWGGGGGGHV